MTQTYGEVLAVYESRERAEAAARRAVEAGVSESGVHIGDKADEIEALRAEMQDELEETVALPGTGIVPDREAKGAAVTIAVATLIGAAVLAPVGLIHWGTMSVGGRVLLAAIIGAVAGATVGYIGAGIVAEGPAELMAAERGVTLRVESDAPHVVQALEAEGPIRLDVLRRQAMNRTGALVEEQSSVTGVVEEITENLRHPGRERRR